MSTARPPEGDQHRSAKREGTPMNIAADKTYPDPIVNLETERYWAAAADGQLLLKRCRSCGQTHFYPRAVCPRCLSSETEWYAASGQGRIYTYSVMRRAPVPYAIVYITLAEGVTMMSNLVDCDLDAIRIGQPVEVVFRPTVGGHSLPVFRPVEARS
jgi:uncharacterized OB-fold protein